VVLKKLPKHDNLDSNFNNVKNLSVKKTKERG